MVEDAVPPSVPSKPSIRRQFVKPSPQTPTPNGDIPATATLRTASNVGFITLPNQIHQKATSRGFSFNLMITGCPGLGKSSFINSLFCSDVFNAHHLGPSKRPVPQGVQVDSWLFLLSEGHVKLRLCILDTPGFGQYVDNSSCWQPLVDCIDSRFESYLRNELKVSRHTVGSGADCMPSLTDDSRVHACLYFVAPTGHGLHQLDIEAMKHLHNKVNLILVIGKADSLTPDECAEFKQEINRQLSEHDIRLYDFPESVVSSEGSLNDKTHLDVKEWRKRQPFAVVCSDRTIVQADGRKVRGRMYPWGMVETENLSHNDFLALKNLLFSYHLLDLIHVTHSKLYTEYYCARLMSIAQASQFHVEPDGREPLYQLEAERLESQKKLAMLEAEMETVFEQKVRERASKLKESEIELDSQIARLNQQLAAENAEFERLKHAFEDQCSVWESENYATLEPLRRASRRHNSSTSRCRVSFSFPRFSGFRYRSACSSPEQKSKQSTAACSVTNRSASRMERPSSCCYHAGLSSIWGCTVQAQERVFKSLSNLLPEKLSSRSCICVCHTRGASDDCMSATTKRSFGHLRERYRGCTDPARGTKQAPPRIYR
ncbi:unnamed protein product [Dicrocoelium dendriticum]|nr:unnamed protein product [Dicrocoelium dendriticum]